MRQTLQRHRDITYFPSVRTWKMTAEISQFERIRFATKTTKHELVHELLVKAQIESTVGMSEDQVTSSDEAKNDAWTVD